MYGGELFFPPPHLFITWIFPLQIIVCRFYFSPWILAALTFCCLFSVQLILALHLRINPYSAKCNPNFFQQQQQILVFRREREIICLCWHHHKLTLCILGLRCKNTCHFLLNQCNAIMYRRWKRGAWWGVCLPRLRRWYWSRSVGVGVVSSKRSFLHCCHPHSTCVVFVIHLVASHFENCSTHFALDPV